MIYPRSSIKTRILGQFRKRIREKIFEELIERSDVSIKVMEETDPESPVLAEMKEEGYINVDYEKLVEYILEFSNGEEGTWSPPVRERPVIHRPTRYRRDHFLSFIQ